MMVEVKNLCKEFRYPMGTVTALTKHLLCRAEGGVVFRHHGRLRSRKKHFGSAVLNYLERPTAGQCS